MMPTYAAIRLAAERQRELEHRAAHDRLVRHFRRSSCHQRPIDRMLSALHHIVAGLTHRRHPTASVRTLAPTNSRCCAT